MRAIILAAGFGSRLMPLTQDIPKCMVMYQNKRIIDYIMEALNLAKIQEICIVGGYKFSTLQQHINTHYNGIRMVCNERYDSTNMVATLFCAKDFLLECIKQKQDLLVSYADIVYFSEIAERLRLCDYDLGIVVDREWRKLWERRFNNPLSDAETLKLDGNKIIELGKKPKHYGDIDGQYIGLFRISHRFLPEVVSYYENLDKKAIYDSKDFDNMYMTSFLQLLIESYKNAHAIELFGNWCEIDFKSDLEVDFIRG